MIPKIEFRYSWVYDDIWRENIEEDKKDLLSKKQIEEYIKELKKKWGENVGKILKKIKDITKIGWKEKRIICYVVAKAIPFSDPLTMRVYKNKEDFIDTLTHELIHRNFIQDIGKAEEMMKPINKKYKNENLNVKIHILVNRIHKKIFENFGWEERMKRREEMMSKLEDYKRSWEIVMNEKEN